MSVVLCLKCSDEFTKKYGGPAECIPIGISYPVCANCGKRSVVGIGYNVFSDLAMVDAWWKAVSKNNKPGAVFAIPEFLKDVTCQRYQPFISKDRKKMIVGIVGSFPSEGYPKLSFFDKVKRFFKTKWRFRAEVTLTQIPPPTAPLQWSKEAVEAMMKMPRVPAEYNTVAGNSESGMLLMAKQEKAAAEYQKIKDAAGKEFLSKAMEMHGEVVGNG